MAAGFVLHGALDRDLFLDSVGEDIFLLAKLGRLNQEYAQHSPGGFMPQTEMLVTSHAAARDRYERIRQLLEFRVRPLVAT